MRRPVADNSPSTNMESATLNDRAAVASDRNYMNAHRYLATLQMRIREMTENETKSPEQLERLQQKVIDIKDVFALVERELERVEDDDWLPRLKLPPRLIEPETPSRTASAPPEDVRPKESRRTSVDDLRGESARDTASRYRPSEDYRPSPPPAPVNHSRSPQPQPQRVPKAPSPPPAVAFAAVPDVKSGMSPASAPLPHHANRDARMHDPGSSNAPLPPLPYNIKFDHGPLFSECVASLKLSDYVYDLVDAKADLKDAHEKLRKAKDADDSAGVQKYTKRASKYDSEIKELEQDHWKLEVNPLRQAYSVEIVRCLQQLDTAIKYTEELPDNGRSEADALSDMGLLKEWLNRCLNQPKTWRKDDRLLVGLIEGHPQRKLRDASYVQDLLDEAAPPAPKIKNEDDRVNAATSSSRKREDEADSDRRSKADQSPVAMKPIAINGDLLEGLLNGAVPKEVAANITQCQECKGTGGDLEHAKICSECDGKGSHPDARDAIELCPKCNGRGFALSKKYRCPVCDAYKIVMNVPADTVDPRKSKDRDPPSTRDPDAAPKRSDSTRRKASFAPEVAAAEAVPQRSRSKKGRDREHDRDRDRDISPDKSEADDFSDSRKSKSRSKKHRDADSGDSRSPSPGQGGRGSRKSQPREQPDAGAGLTGLIGAIAGAAQEPGKWSGAKGKKILEAALAAGAGGMLGGGGGGGGGGDRSDDGRSEDEEDDRHGKHHRKRRSSRHER